MVDLIDLFDLVDLNGSGVDFYSVACQNVNEAGKLGQFLSIFPSVCVQEVSQPVFST